MKPVIFNRMRAGVSVVLTLGAGGLLVAGRSSSTEVNYSVAAQVRITASTCREFMDDDASMLLTRNANDAGKVKLKLYRHKHPGDLKPKNGELVGAIENRDTRTSVSFPRLKSGESACIWFKQGATDADRDVAEYWDTQGGKYPLGYALHCYHGMRGNILNRPVWAVLPAGLKCEKIKMSFANVTVMIERPATGPWNSAVVVSQMRSKLGGRRIPQNMIDAMVKQATQSYGPWYPCDPDGCCRAGEM